MNRAVRLITVRAKDVKPGDVVAFSLASGRTAWREITKVDRGSQTMLSYLYGDQPAQRRYENFTLVQVQEVALCSA